MVLRTSRCHFNCRGISSLKSRVPAFLNGTSVAQRRLHTQSLKSRASVSHLYEEGDGDSGQCKRKTRAHLPLSLFSRVKNMPPEGFTLTDGERSCDRNEVFCRTPLHVWELKCPKCLGSGNVAVDRRKKKSRILSVCPQCSGLGHVRYISSDLDGANSIPYYLLRHIDEYG